VVGRRITVMVGGTDEQVRVRLTVIDPSRVGAQVDVEVVAPRGTTVRTVSAQFLAAMANVGRGWGAARPQALPEARPGLFVDGDAVESAVLGSPPLLQGAVVTVGQPGGAAGRDAKTCGGLAEVHVVAGPDAGTRLPLSPGVTRLGRGTEVTLRIADPDVSRTHAEIIAAGTTVRVRDLGSTNGTRLGSRLVGAEAVDWAVEEPLYLGTSSLALRTLDSATAGGGSAATTADGSGRLLVNPAPRLPPPPVGGLVTFPEPPPEPARAHLPWLVSVLPLLVSVPLAWWSKQLAFLALTLLSPLMMLGQYLVDRRERLSGREQAVAEYRAASEAAQNELDDLLAAERARLLLDHPDPAAVAATAAEPSRRLWERRPGDPDETVLRLGLGLRRSAIGVRGSPPSGCTPPGHPPSGCQAPVLDDAPVTLDLASAATGGVAGLAGPRREVLALARCLVGQAAVASSPQRLRIVVLTPDGDRRGDWAWAAWLPHADDHLPVAPTIGGANSPPASPGATGAGPRPGEQRVLLVLDGAARLRRDPRVAALLASTGSALLALCLDDAPVRLPAECGATVELGPTGTDPGGLLVVRGDEPLPLRPDLVSPAWAERLGRDLARLADATPRPADTCLPAQVRLLDLVQASDRLGTTGTIGLDGSTVAAGWRRHRAARAPATTAIVGVTTNGPWDLDLARHGPHALVAGTTGAGKSELLTTLVASLALAHPPDRLHLLLVDYKGGTAFGPLGDLPHAAGVLTDLDDHVARRALSSLRAELRRREALLRAAGVADLDDYDQRHQTGPPLPRLVIVVDEFRVLAEELPDLLTGLVRVATVGRSLGVHLVLATQRPTGVVTAEIRANVNLRIALRVRDRMDSEDVVEAPDAALLPVERPGRGVSRSGNGPLVEFQTARVTGRVPRSCGQTLVRRLRRDGPLATAWQLHPSAAEPPNLLPAPRAAPTSPENHREAVPDDVTVIVTACREAARLDGIPSARAPWLSPLPSMLRPVDLPALLAESIPADRSGLPAGSPSDRSHGTGAGGAGGSCAASLDLVLGVTDLPQVQAREPLRWVVPAEGHLAVVGAPRSGRTGILRAVVGAACRSSRPVHVHVVDGGGHLGDLVRLPRVGTVVPTMDTERAGRLLAHLSEQVRRGAASRALRTTPSAVPLPLRLLLVDGWEQVLDSWLPVDHGRLVDDLLHLARDASGTGLRLAITGGRALLVGQVASVLSERLLLRTTDSTDLVVAGVPAAALPTVMPPGRVLRVLSGHRTSEAQTFLDDPAVDLTGHVTPELDEEPPLRLAALPDRLDLRDLLEVLGELRDGGGEFDGTPDGRILPIGLGGDDARPLGPPARGPGWLVVGASGSGRSTALATAAEMLRTIGRAVVAIATPGSPLTDLAAHSDLAVVPPAAVRSGATDLLRTLDDAPHATLVVDDLTALVETRVEDEVLARLDAAATSGPFATATAGHFGQAARWPSGDGPHVLAACTPGQAAVSFRGLVARLRATGAALLLAPHASSDGDAFGIRVPTHPRVPPGRAALVVGTVAQTVQVARVDDDASNLRQCAPITRTVHPSA
jgi:S-DNA-T family DNA segregation ATPase FtsK/SpoIIIE